MDNFFNFRVPSPMFKDTTRIESPLFFDDFKTDVNISPSRFFTTTPPLWSPTKNLQTESPTKSLLTTESPTFNCFVDNIQPNGLIPFKPQVLKLENYEGDEKKVGEINQNPTNSIQIEYKGGAFEKFNNPSNDNNGTHSTQSIFNSQNQMIGHQLNNSFTKLENITNNISLNNNNLQKNNNFGPNVNMNYNNNIQYNNPNNNMKMGGAFSNFETNNNMNNNMNCMSNNMNQTNAPFIGGGNTAFSKFNVNSHNQPNMILNNKPINGNFPIVNNNNMNTMNNMNPMNVNININNNNLNNINNTMLNNLNNNNQQHNFNFNNNFQQQNLPKTNNPNPIIPFKYENLPLYNQSLLNSQNTHPNFQNIPNNNNSPFVKFESVTSFPNFTNLPPSSLVNNQVPSQSPRSKNQLPSDNSNNDNKQPPNKKIKNKKNSLEKENLVCSKNKNIKPKFTTELTPTALENIHIKRTQELKSPTFTDDGHLKNRVKEKKEVPEKIQCLGSSKKKGTQCKNAALLEYIGPRPLYCAEHIEEDKNTLHGKCKCPYFKEKGDGKACKQIILKELVMCYRHFDEVLLNLTLEKARRQKTLVVEMIKKLRQDSKTFLKTNIDLYQRKSKLLPKYIKLDNILSKFIAEKERLETE